MTGNWRQWVFVGGVRPPRTPTFPFLWSMGEIHAYNKVIEFLNKVAYIKYCKVSRADLCVDRIMSLPEIDRKSQVVSVLRDKALFYGGDFQRGQRITGYQFGRGGMTGRFYDKSYEISIKHNSHVMPVWRENGWDGESPVSRLEIQLRREGLRKFDKTMDFINFQNSKADIWAYGTDRLLRIVDPDSASRKERAKVIEYWQDYQACSELFGVRLGILPYHQFNPEWEPLVNQANGCLASAFARLSANVGETEAIMILERHWGKEIPKKVIEVGIIQKARFMHMS